MLVALMIECGHFPVCTFQKTMYIYLVSTSHYPIIIRTFQLQAHREGVRKFIREKFSLTRGIEKIAMH